MGRRRGEDKTRQMPTRRNGGGGYPGRGYGGNESPRGGERRSSQGYDRLGYPVEARYGPYHDRGGSRYYEDEDGNRYYAEDYEGRYDRGRDSEREYYWRERESRQETRRTAYMVLGGVCVAVIALVAVLALLGDGSSQQTAGQSPQQAAPQPAPAAPAPQPTPQVPQVPQQPQAPGVPAPSAPSSEQVEGLRADIDRQLAEIRQSINQLRLEIWALFTSNEQGEREGSS